MNAALMYAMLNSTTARSRSSGFTVSHQTNNHYSSTNNKNNMEGNQNDIIKLQNGFMFDAHTVNYVKLPYEALDGSNRVWVLEIGFCCGKSVVKLTYPDVKASMVDYKLIMTLMSEYIDGMFVHCINDLSEDDMKRVRRG